MLAINFFAKFIVHIEGVKAGEPIILEPWQRAVIGSAFGWKRPLPQNGLRRYRIVYCEIPRGNGKSTIVGGIALLCLYLDDEPGAQIFSAAGTRDQAKIVFSFAKQNVLRNRTLKRRGTVYQNSIVHQKDGILHGSYKAISADADHQHGGSPHAILFDELHTQPNRELWDVLETGKVKRRQPITFAITTAGWDRNSICWEQHDHACKVRDGIIDDPEFLPVVYAADAEDDWTDPAVWRKANPNLGVSISEETLASACRRAKENPAAENAFRRLHLNQWTEQDVRWLSMAAWDACHPTDETPRAWRERMLVELLRRQCVSGLDIGSTSDTTACVLLFGDEANGFDVLPFFWIPEERARTRERRDRVPYRSWADQGFVTITEGNETDYDIVERDIDALANRYGLHELAVDRLFQGAQLSQRLIKRGMNVVTFGQGFMSMASPTDAFAKLVTQGKIRHGGNPVLRWMASNVSVAIDDAGNMKPSRKKSTEKIDGIVAAIMALGRAIVTGSGRSVYETEGLLVI